MIPPNADHVLKYTRLVNSELWGSYTYNFHLPLQNGDISSLVSYSGPFPGNEDLLNIQLYFEQIKHIFAEK